MNDEIENKLRNSIEGRKGALGKALSEGAQLWIDLKSKKTSHPGSNFKIPKRNGSKR